MARTISGKFYCDGRLPQARQHREVYDKREPYWASVELIRAVNLAIFLGRPLLIEGEAGCGKSRLARAVAYEMGLPFYSWSVRSTSKAQDGLFQYDALLRLYDVQMHHSIWQNQAGNNPTDNPEEKAKLLRDPRDPGFYYTLGPLGHAFRLKECPGVVLIDEIDKADLDFPNDLLAVLDEPWSFTLPENQEEIAATHVPIVIITSNKEKGNLPFPFLRRCLYHYVEFPSPAILKEIVRKHHEEKQPPPVSLVEAAINRFQQLRESGNLHKKPGTSEFLDWVKALHEFDPDMECEEQLRDENARNPYPEVIFKLRADWPRTPIRR